MEEISRSRKLRELLDRRGPLVCPGVYDCLSALLVEAAGFDAGFISGAAIAASVLGFPDVGLQTMQEILTQSRNMARAVSIPLIVDIDTGYGNALNAAYAAREFERTGIAGVFIEDQSFPKRCGHFEGKHLVDTKEMSAKVSAIREATRDDAFVIIARTDARAVEGFDSAIERSNAYVEAGADVVFVEALLTLEEMINCPLQMNLTEDGKTPMATVAELAEMGYKIVSYSGTLQRAAQRSMERVLEVLQSEGTTVSLFPQHVAGLVDRSAVLKLDEFYAYEESIYGPILESEASWKDSVMRIAATKKERPAAGGIPGSF